MKWKWHNPHRIESQGEWFTTLNKESQRRRKRKGEWNKGQYDDKGQVDEDKEEISSRSDAEDFVLLVCSSEKH